MKEWSSNPLMLIAMESVPQRGSVWLNAHYARAQQGHTLPRCGTDCLSIR
ncbi:MAG TPA: hypothetical protein VIK24_17550 [Pyrinomonadaceae bacterium]